MLTFLTLLVLVLFLLVGVLGWLVYTLHAKLQKMEKNQAIMLEWFDSISKNEETLQDDIKKLFYEFKAIGKEIGQKIRVAPKAEVPVRPR
jgi:predicted Holliday junction resolvase-like endonuclease